MDYSIWAFLLAAVGIALLVVELFIPSGGVILVMALLSLLGCVICAWNAWWSSSQGLFWGFLAGLVVLLPICLGVGLYFWPQTPLGRRAILDAPAPHEIDAFSELESKYAQLVGKVGETSTLLNPAGIVLIDGQRIHCQSEGMILEPGTRVKVIAARINGVIVRKFDGAPPNDSEAGGGPSAAGPLDFEIS
jgi:membrane-bound ClpP family serine protease